MKWKEIDKDIPDGKKLFYLGWSEIYGSHAFISWNKEENCFWDDERNRKLIGYKYWMDIPPKPNY